MHEAKMIEGIKGDVLPRVIERTIQNGRIICFDEFQVTDVADALLLRRLFTGLLERGAVIVATSNRPPRDLYLNGLQRDRFIPFIELLEERTVVVSMWQSVTDYRLVHGRRKARGVYFVGNVTNKAEFDETFRDFVRNDGINIVGPTSLTTQGRRVKVPMASLIDFVARFAFDDLCRKAMGAADYLAIAETFHTVFVENVPIMTLNEINVVRRFITFVDVMYECQVKLVIHAEALPEDLFAVDLSNRYQDEAFAFDRTRSRLEEMGGESYLKRRWVGRQTKERRGDQVFVGPEPNLQY